MILPSKCHSTTARTVERYSETILPTERGPVRTIIYRECEAKGVVNEHVAMVFGELPDNGEDVLMRVHSECMTSEVFGSLKCDCKDQLDAAYDRLAENESGVILYLRQEGRGIGLGNKIRAYALQESGANTIEANHQLGFATDYRRYDIAAGMLHDLGIKSVELMTNNPLKIAGLEEYGIDVKRRVDHNVSFSEHAADYVDVKRSELGHFKK